MTKAEQDFVEQYARTHLVRWCCQTLENGYITSVSPETNDEVVAATAARCLDHAKSKGWVGKSDPPRVLAKGFSTAAAFLKR